MTVSDPPTQPDNVTPIRSDWPSLVGFEFVTEAPPPRLVLCAFGSEKTGKSSLGLSFPSPKVYLNIDYGLDELFITRPELFNQVLRRNFELNEMDDPATWETLLKDFHEHYVRGLEYANTHKGSVIVDTASQLWEIVQEVHVRATRDARIAAAKKKAEGKSKKDAEEIMDRAEKPNRLDYAAANSFMGGLQRRAMHYPHANVLFINKARDEYDRTGQQTGGLLYHGFGDTSAIVQAVVQTYKKEGVHYALITRCRFDTTLEGVSIKNPSYETLRGMLLGV